MLPGRGTRRLLAIGLVWLASSLAWAVLGATLTARSGRTSAALLGEVHALWGPELVSVTFFREGFTGLAITVGAILTPFVIMQLTGKLDRDRVLSGAARAQGGAGA
ncbi:MAG TPA: hypothetical protein VF841_02080 [Anaeromyxobacter sp.]